MPLFERYVRWLVRRAWLVLALVAVATALVASGLSKLRTEFSVEASLPEEHHFVQIDKTIRKEFGGRHALIAAVVPRQGDVWTPETLAVVRDFTLGALKLPDVIAQNVVSLAAPSVRHVEDRDGNITVDYLMRDVPQTPEEIAALRRNLESDPSLRGMLVTDDQKAAIVAMDFWEGPQSQDIAQRVLDLIATFEGRGVDIYAAGEPIVALTDLGQSALIAKRIPVTFIVIALMLLVSFRSVQGMIIPMLTATLSTVWALGLMGHTGIVIDTWNVAVPILLIAVAAAHSAQMLKRYVEEVVRTGDNKQAVIRSTVKIGPVMIAAGATAALGFMSLALFGVRSIANLGLSCGYGIASAVLLELTFIPALRAVLPAPRRLPPEGGLTAKLLEAIHRGVVRAQGRAVLIGTGVVLVLAAIGIANIRTFGPTREYMPHDSLSRQNLEKIEEHFQGTVNMTVLYEGPPGTTKSLPVLRHIAALQEVLEQDPIVLRTASIADIVKTLHQTFNASDPKPYRLPDDQELTAQLMFLGESPAFERFSDRAQTKTLVVAYLHDDDSAQVGPLVRRLEEWVAKNPPPDGVEVLIAGGFAPTVLAVNEHTTYGKMLNMLVVLAVIYLVSSAIMRSAVAGLYVLTPIVITVLVLFGGLGWTGVRLDMGSSSVIAMAAGVGADYAIYFLFRLREEHQRFPDDRDAVHEALRTSGRAVIFVAASIGAGFAVIAVSPFLGMKLFGTLMPAAMVVACLASLTVMPVMALRLRPRFLFGDPAEHVDVASAAEPAPAR
ncbi:MAG: MMPL family transporter [bacterium]|nr:MMPL family transporter [bacterium]